MAAGKLKGRGEECEKEAHEQVQEHDLEDVEVEKATGAYHAPGRVQEDDVGRYSHKERRK